MPIFTRNHCTTEYQDQGRQEGQKGYCKVHCFWQTQKCNTTFINITVCRQLTLIGYHSKTKSGIDVNFLLVSKHWGFMIIFHFKTVLEHSDDSDLLE